LKLPKSTLQTQFAHGAQSDVESDFNFETEYLLDCSIPATPLGEPIFLKDCLYDYFTNIVQVRRQLLTTPAEQRTRSSAAPTPNYSTKPFSSADARTSFSGAASSSSSGAPPPYVGDGNGVYGSDEKATLKKAEIFEERNVAAWQVSPHLMAVFSDGKFFKLLPYYAPTSTTSEVTKQLANERPMLGICLKRYGYDTIRKQPYRDGRK